MSKYSGSDSDSVLTKHLQTPIFTSDPLILMRDWYELLPKHEWGREQRLNAAARLTIIGLVIVWAQQTGRITPLLQAIGIAGVAWLLTRPFTIDSLAPAHHGAAEGTPTPKQDAQIYIRTTDKPLPPPVVPSDEARVYATRPPMFDTDTEWLGASSGVHVGKFVSSVY
jgi:hypothetical protein